MRHAFYTFLCRHCTTTLRTLTSEDKIFFLLMNLVIVLFTFEETFSPLSPLPSLASALSPPPPPPPQCLQALSFSLPAPFRFLSYSLLTRFFWRWLRAWRRLCCDGLTPLFPLPRQLENGQTRKSCEKYCKARVGHEYHPRWSAWVGFQRRNINPASFLTNISVT